MKKELAAKFREWVSATFPSILVIVAIDLALTVIFFGFSAPATHIGTLRPEDTIAPKVLQLASVGLGLGLLASLSSRRFDFRLITFGFAFTVLLDLDHLPAFFGVLQPIRPAHSLSFLAIGFVVLYLTVARNHPEIPVVFASAFFGHIAADSGVFAFYAPISFDYISLNEFKIPFSIVAICLAFFAGYFKYRRGTNKQFLTFSGPIDVRDVSKKR